VSDGTTLGQLLEEATAQLNQAELCDAALEARLLIQAALKLSRTQLVTDISRVFPTAHSDAVAKLIERRISGEPVFRIIGHREFYGLEMGLSQDTLEPRPDTETLVDAVLDQVRGANREGETLRFADLGTGSGAIAISLLSNLPNAQAIATDISLGALEQARKNATALGVSDRLNFVMSNWTADLVGQFDFIVSNPPYIESEVVDGLQPNVLNYDPRRALDGGLDGLDAYRAILGSAKNCLKPGGFMALEIGYDQADSLNDLSASLAWELLELRQDIGGRDRVVLLKAK